MAKIKIVSNPYDREIKYYSFNGFLNDWEDIKNNNPNSKLREDETGKTFLPFKIKEIIDIIIDEYFNGSEKIDIVFEGTLDEYAEVESVCNEVEIRDKVNLSKTAVILENARLIFKDTKDIFETVHPIIKKIVKDDKRIVADLNKVSDALNDIIPICVFGNYSAGKSTFINALVGHEVLPSGGDPVTAKIFKIKRSAYEDLALISFIVDEMCYEIAFEGNSIRVIKGDSSSVIIQELTAVTENQDKNIFAMVKAALEFLNGYEKNSPNTDIGSVIELEIPFSKKGIMGQSYNNYVIIDTPGSNTKTYAEHAKVLEEALEGFSNGIPVWVSVYESIDSEDNAKLCEKIEGIQALDKRFTMIVLNKADGSDLVEGGFSKEQIREILEYEAVERMYSSGIYFVSSIMGLGAKNDGELVDKHYRKIYRSQQDMYSDPEDVDYATLYKYNIMPEQIKESAVEYSENCPSLIYANSGLYCIEREIENFGSKHSAYNKCQMVYLFLNTVIDETSKRITSRTESLKRTRAAREHELDAAKKQLIDSLLKATRELEFTFDKNSKGYVRNFVTENLDYSHTVEEMNTIDKEIREKNFEEADFQTQERDYADSKQSFWSHLKANSQSLFEGKFLDSVKELKDDLVRDIKEMQDSKSAMDSAEKEIDKVSSDKMLRGVVSEYKKNINLADEILSKTLKEYWYQSAQTLRNKLIEIITDSEALTVSQREEISSIIINYEPLEITDDADIVFIKKRFLRGYLFGFRLNDSEKLNTRLLTSRYNEKIKKNVYDMAVAINASYFTSFKTWEMSLHTVIEENITDYNPQLRDMAAMIKEETEKIMELESDQNAISSSLEAIKSLMSWKVIE